MELQYIKSAKPSSKLKPGWSGKCQDAHLSCAGQHRILRLNKWNTHHSPTGFHYCGLLAAFLFQILCGSFLEVCPRGLDLNLIRAEDSGVKDWEGLFDSTGSTDYERLLRACSILASVSLSSSFFSSISFSINSSFAFTSFISSRTGSVLTMCS